MYSTGMLKNVMMKLLHLKIRLNFKVIFQNPDFSLPIFILLHSVKWQQWFNQTLFPLYFQLSINAILFFWTRQEDNAFLLKVQQPYFRAEQANSG